MGNLPLPTYRLLHLNFSQIRVAILHQRLIYQQYDGKAQFITRNMKGLRRNDDELANKSWYQNSLLLSPEKNKRTNFQLEQKLNTNIETCKKKSLQPPIARI